GGRRRPRVGRPLPGRQPGAGLARVGVSVGDVLRQRLGVVRDRGGPRPLRELRPLERSQVVLGRRSPRRLHDVLHLQPRHAAAARSRIFRPGLPERRGPTRRRPGRRLCGDAPLPPPL
ncbi:MAG: hypothetical protein AVDCRST_MAG02-1569, partial [uncultured Rubrobacteraceae bacterium]